MNNWQKQRVPKTKFWSNVNRVQSGNKLSSPLINNYHAFVVAQLQKINIYILEKFIICHERNSRIDKEYFLCYKPETVKQDQSIVQGTEEADGSNPVWP